MCDPMLFFIEVNPSFYAGSICTTYVFFLRVFTFCNVSCIFLDQVKEDIFLAYENHMKDEDLNTCIKAKGLLLDTIRIITNASGESSDTVKVGSTGTEINASQQSNNSGDTVKVQSTELQEENDRGVSPFFFAVILQQLFLF